jgi:hypothetical protein
VDADCGPGTFCSPSVGSCGAPAGIIGYYCHGPNDKCIDDADCPSTITQPQVCWYNALTAAWHCGFPICTG